MKRLFTEEGQTGAQIAEKYGMTKANVYDTLNRMGVDTSASRRFPSLKKADLKKLYEKEKLSLYQIAERLAVTYKTVQRHMRHFGIELRSHAEQTALSRPMRATDLTKDTLHQLYEVDGLSQQQIAEQFGYGQAYISILVRKHGLMTAKELLYQVTQLFVNEGKEVAVVADTLDRKPALIKKIIKKHDLRKKKKDAEVSAEQPSADQKVGV